MSDDAPRPIIESPDGGYETNGDPALAPRLRDGVGADEGDTVARLPPQLCGAVHPRTGATCTLEAGHEPNHWGLFQHGSVQWPTA